MAHITQAESHPENKNEVRNVTIILSVLTLVELALGFWMYKAGMEGFLRGAVKGTIIILMLAKAFYIVAYFMHLGHEIKNLIMTIVVPLFLFVWFIISFLYDGHSYKHLRNTYDRNHYEESSKSYNTNDKDAPENKKKPAMD